MSGAHDIDGEGAVYASPLHELVALAHKKGYAVDFAIYGGEHLDTHFGGARITGHAGDPMGVISAGVRALEDAEPNADRRLEPCPRCQSRSVNCPLSGPGCPYDEPDPDPGSLDAR